MFSWIFSRCNYHRVYSNIFIDIFNGKWLAVHLRLLYKFPRNCYIRRERKKYFYVCQLIWTDVNIMCKDLWLIDTDSKLEPNNFQYVRDITMACVYLSWRIKINDSHILQSCVLLIYVRKIKRRKFLLYIIQIVSTIFSKPYIKYQKS